MKHYKIAFLILALGLAACGGGSGGDAPPDSPAATLRTYVEASQQKDIEAMKRQLSQESLVMMEGYAKQQDTTVDEILRKGSAVEIDKIPEMRNEKIEGDAATVEVKNELNGNFDLKLFFVRENGVWKIALDRYRDEMLRKLNEDMNKPPTDVPAEPTNK